MTEKKDKGASAGASGGEKTILVIGEPHEGIANLLEMGRRVEAAVYARQMGKNSAVEDLRKLVGVLADELESIGDRHEGRGRPRTAGAIFGSKQWKQDQKIKSARGSYLDAIDARDVVDGYSIDAQDLAYLVFWWMRGLPEGVKKCGDLDATLDRAADKIKGHESQVAELLLPYARQHLDKYKLGPDRVRRQGFKTFAATVIANHYGVPEDSVKRKSRKKI